MLTRTNPITPKQCAYLSRLIARLGKEQYKQAKSELGLTRKTIMRLSREEASALIDQLKAGRQ